MRRPVHAGITRLLLALLALAALGEEALGQRYRSRQREGPRGNYEMALGAAYGTTSLYDTTVTSIGARGWVTVAPTLLNLGDAVQLGSMFGIELGWGKLSRALPYNASNTHGLIRFYGGPGVTAQLAQDTDVAAHLYYDVQSDGDFQDPVVDAAEQWSLRLSVRRGALVGRLTLPARSVGFGSGRMTEATLWWYREQPTVGVRYQRVTRGQEAVTTMMLMIGLVK